MRESDVKIFLETFPACNTRFYHEESRTGVGSVHIVLRGHEIPLRR